MMPALAERFEVIAVDQRGMGLSDKPRDGYDTATIANDLVALMDALGHQRFAMAAATPECSSATPWPLITPTGSTAWPSGKPRFRACLPRRRCSSPRRSTNACGTSRSTHYHI